VVANRMMHGSHVSSVFAVNRHPSNLTPVRLRRSQPLSTSEQGAEDLFDDCLWLSDDAGQHEKHN